MLSSTAPASARQIIPLRFCCSRGNVGGVSHAFCEHSDQDDSSLRDDAEMSRAQKKAEAEAPLVINDAAEGVLTTTVAKHRQVANVFSLNRDPI